MTPLHPDRLREVLYSICKPKPKRTGKAPRSGYLIFQSDNRKEVIKDLTTDEVPNPPQTAVVREIARRWKLIGGTKEHDRYIKEGEAEKLRMRIPEPGTLTEPVEPESDSEVSVNGDFDDW